MRKIVSFLLIVVLLLSFSCVIFADEQNMLFLDISNESEYYEAVDWGVKKGIIYGTDTGKFLPDEPLNFGQFSVILSRYANKDVVNSGDWQQELFVRSNACVRDGWMPAYLLDNLTLNVPYNFACSVILKIKDIEYPTFSEVSGSFNSIYFLQQIGLIEELPYEEYTLISRGDFIKLLYEVDKYDFNTLSYEIEYTHSDIIEQFGNQIVFEGGLDVKDGEREGHRTVVLKNMYLNNLNKVPEKIRECFINEGWVLYIGGETISKYDSLYDRQPLGLTDYNNKIIAVRSPVAIVHEFGHYLQWYINKLTTFNEYYLEGKDSIKVYRELLVSDNPNIDVDFYKTMEYFAVVFDLYISSQYEMGINTQYAYESFSKSAPHTWQFFKDLEEHNWERQ